MPDSLKNTPVLSVRLSDEDRPRRSEEFEKALAKGGATATNAIKALVDSYIDYVNKHDRLPSFPLEIVCAAKKK